MDRSSDDVISDTMWAITWIERAKPVTFSQNSQFRAEI
jgi:hypothetical protein